MPDVVLCCCGLATVAHRNTAFAVDCGSQLGLLGFSRSGNGNHLVRVEVAYRLKSAFSALCALRRAHEHAADHPRRRDTGEHELVQMRWGLILFFTKQLSDVHGISTINARAELW